jgi:flavin-dependent dehydrogenase
VNTDRQSPQVVVVGAGIAGLSAAMAMRAVGCRVAIVERDPEPAPDADHWRRSGVPHAVQPHFLMGRLRSLFLDRYPGLFAMLREEGVDEIAFADYLHPLARTRYVPKREDALLTVIASRRTTLERTMRRFVHRNSMATIIPHTTVNKLLLAEREGTPYVCGVETRTEGSSRIIPSEIVIDATGRTDALARLLASAGVESNTEHFPCNILYFTQWFRLRPGKTFPSTSGLPGQIFDDFVIGALPADNGRFTVTLQVHRDDTELTTLAKHPETFREFCRRLPAIAPWIDPDRAEATGPIYGFGMMDYLWRSWVVKGEPRILGFFAVGDSVIRSNPRFGRGCTWAALGAHLLADVVAETHDPRLRLVRYEKKLRDTFRKDWMTMLAIERTTQRRFQIAVGRTPATLRDRFASLLDRRLLESLIADPAVFRAVWSGYNGFARMSSWTTRFDIWARIIKRSMVGPGELSNLINQLRTRPSRSEIGEILDRFAIFSS